MDARGKGVSESCGSFFQQGNGLSSAASLGSARPCAGIADSRAVMFWLLQQFECCLWCLPVNGGDSSYDEMQYLPRFFKSQCTAPQFKTFHQEKAGVIVFPAP